MLHLPAVPAKTQLMATAPTGPRITDAQLGQRLIDYHDNTLGDWGREYAVQGFRQLVERARAGRTRGLARRVVEHFDGLVEGRQGFVTVAMPGYLELVKLARGPVLGP